MNWADTMKLNADSTSMELGSTHLSVSASVSPSSWEPHEVWLTRIKVPRDKAAMLGEQARAESTDEYKLF